MLSLVLRKDLKLALVLGCESWIESVGNPSHNALVAFGAHLGLELAATLEGRLVRLGRCVDKSVSHNRIIS